MLAGAVLAGAVLAGAVLAGVQGKGWFGVGLMRGCHTCRSRCVSGSGCLGPLPPPVPPAPLLLPPPLPAPAPLLPLPLLPPPLPPLPRPPPAFSGEALRASGGGGGGGSRLRVVVRSLHPSQPRHLHQEPESASAPRTRDRRSREHAQGRWRGARAQCWSDGLHHCTHCAVGVSWLCSEEHELAAPAAGGIGRQDGDQDAGINGTGQLQWHKVCKTGGHSSGRRAQTYDTGESSLKSTASRI